MLYQIGTIRSLLNGVYEGDVSVEALARYGDFGLGTFDAVNGEMILLDGRFYRVDADGRANPVAPGTKTPFAVVTRFEGGEKRQAESYTSLGALEEELVGDFESPNIIYAVRLEGEFASVHARSEHPRPEATTF